jgi:hypothetical protein
MSEQYQVPMDPKWKYSVKKLIDFIFHTSGFGSQSSEQIESKTLEIVNAGDHCERRISRHIAPFELIFGWKIFVVNLNKGFVFQDWNEKGKKSIYVILGGLNG